MASLLKKIERSSVDSGLKLNKTKCSILAVDRAEILPVHFELIPDIARNGSVIFLGARVLN